MWVVVACNSEEKEPRRLRVGEEEEEKKNSFPPFFFLLSTRRQIHTPECRRRRKIYPPSHFLDGAPPAQPLSRHQELRHRKPRRHSRSDFTLSTDVRLFACAPCTQTTRTQSSVGPSGSAARLVPSPEHHLAHRPRVTCVLTPPYRVASEFISHALAEHFSLFGENL